MFPPQANRSISPKPRQHIWTGPKTGGERDTHSNTRLTDIGRTLTETSSIVSMAATANSCSSSRSGTEMRPWSALEGGQKTHTSGHFRHPSTCLGPNAPVMHAKSKHLSQTRKRLLGQATSTVALPSVAWQQATYSAPEVVNGRPLPWPMIRRAAAVHMRTWHKRVDAMGYYVK